MGGQVTPAWSCHREASPLLFFLPGHTWPSLLFLAINSGELLLSHLHPQSAHGVGSSFGAAHLTGEQGALSEAA